MKCLYCEKDTYFQPYSKSVRLKSESGSCNVYRCLDCNAQFSYEDDELKHIAFFVSINNKKYYVSQYLPTSLHEGSTSVLNNGNRIFSAGFIENLSPSNLAKKLKFWLTFS